jgi:hypothetical protein
MPEWLAYSSTVLVVLGTLVTAIATTFLWRVTRTLAAETRRMAEAIGRPQVVATLETNRWAFNHADVKVTNTGTGTAYDIRIVFDPPLGSLKAEDRPAPIEQVSVLNPGQRFSSYLCEFALLLGKSFVVTVSWRRDPSKEGREQLSYVLNMKDVDGLSRLGPSDPAVELAEQVKKLREDWRQVATGFQRVKADVYTHDDRVREREQMDERRRQLRGAHSSNPEA